MSAMLMERVSSFVPMASIIRVVHPGGGGASGYVARETVLLSNLSVVGQALGKASRFNANQRVVGLTLRNFPGFVTDSNVTLNDQISGIMGLGFPRLSVMSPTVENGENQYTCDFLP